MKDKDFEKLIVEPIMSKDLSPGVCIFAINFSEKGARVVRKLWLDTNQALNTADILAKQISELFNILSEEIAKMNNQSDKDLKTAERMMSDDFKNA